MFKHDRTQPGRKHTVRRSPGRIRLSELAGVVAIVALAAAPRPAAAQRQVPVKATNIVYTESNDPDGNAIFAFSRGADGSLTPTPSSW